MPIISQSTSLLGASGIPARAQVSQIIGGDYSTASTSYVNVDAANLIATLTLTGRHVKVTITGAAQLSVSGGGIAIAVNDGSADLQVLGEINGTTSAFPLAGTIVLPSIYTGATTFTLRFRAIGATTATIKNANAPQDLLTFIVEELLS